jgi:hypothetical protein
LNNKQQENPSPVIAATAETNNITALKHTDDVDNILVIMYVRGDPQKKEDPPRENLHSPAVYMVMCSL